MIKEVEVSRRIAYRELIVRLEFCEMPRDCSREEREAISMDVDRDLKAELKDCNTLNVMKIMGAIVNPLFQNKKRMMAAGLCTELQYEHGTAELIRRIAVLMIGLRERWRLLMTLMEAGMNGQVVTTIMLAQFLLSPYPRRKQQMNSMSTCRT